MSTPTTPTLTPTPGCPDTPTPSLLPHRRQRQQPQPLRQQSAAEGSLRSLLLQHSSKRLYIHPLSWTPLHVELFCCHVTVKKLIIPRSPPQQHPSQYLKDALEVLDELQLLESAGLERNNHSEELITLLGSEAQLNCQIGPGYVETFVLLYFRSFANCVRTLVLRYNQKPVCSFKLPVIARHNGRLLWAYIDSSWIEKLHEQRKPKENSVWAREKRAVSENGLLISPFCMAILLAMAQEVPPKQPVCVYIF